MNVQPVVKQTDNGFALGFQHKGDNNPRWLWSVDQQMIVELWMIGIRTVPGRENSGSKFTVALYADSNAEAWYLWENKMVPWLLAEQMSK